MIVRFDIQASSTKFWNHIPGLSLVSTENVLSLIVSKESASDFGTARPGFSPIEQSV